MQAARILWNLFSVSTPVEPVGGPAFSPDHTCSAVRVNIGPMTEASTRRLIADLQAVMAEAEALVAKTADDVGERATQARAKAAESVERAQAGLDDLETQLAERAKALLDEVADYVRDKPWQSLGIAAAVGVVVGVLLGRR